ncbi:MAG: acetate/propionate family kinase [Gemmatimonadales bacterium]
MGKSRTSSARSRPPRILLVVNCGSATLKYQSYELTTGGPRPTAGGVVETQREFAEGVRQVLRSLPLPPDAIAHRVVHGGKWFTGSVLIDDEVLGHLRDAAPLDPLHNGPALAGIEATLPLGLPMVAAFDTSFHRTLPERAWRYAIPAELEVRRFGFHGWSHQSVTRRYAELTGSSEPTIITLHLGGGCSAAAVERGRSVDTSMGYSPLEGLVMSTRPGDLDPGVLIHLLQEGLSLDRIVRLLNRGSGLVALAGTADMRELLRRTDQEAELAIDLFCYRIRKYVGAYLAALEGAEAIVFTGGIGENSPEIRRRVCERLGWAGLTLDPQRNAAGGGRISTDGSRLAAFAIRTNEEQLIAEEAARLLGA